jgi:hypothetical protein
LQNASRIARGAPEVQQIDVVEREYSDEGVDLTLIRWMQSLTPRERLDFLRSGNWMPPYRAEPDRQTPGPQLLLTKFGPLDFPGIIGKSRTWDDPAAHCGTMEIDPGITVRVLNLETQIAVKEELDSPKDLAVLPVLREAWKAQKSRQHPPAES